MNFGEPIAVAYEEGSRCYDPCLWIDPLGRLWFIWAKAPGHAVYAVICDNPDADELSWSGERIIGNDVMMNKPTVLTTGEWLFPIAVWNYGIITGGFDSENKDNDRKAFVYKTVDNGENFSKLGGADVEKRSFDEHMVLELSDGTLAMYVRTHYGIGVAYSHDRGKTWTSGKDSKLGGPSSRFFIKRLRSGRILLINHHNFTGRNNLTAMLSEDEGKTWAYKLVLDERNQVSYPDAAESDDGYIYITYDRERGAFLKSINEVYSSAREILVARITEDDIINGSLINAGSKLKIVASKLGKYIREAENPFAEIDNYSGEELTTILLSKTNEDLLSVLFETYHINCINMHRLDNSKLDMLIGNLKSGICDREKTVGEIISLIRSVDVIASNEIPVVERVKDILHKSFADDIQISALAEKIGISMHYMCHLFKKSTGVSIVEYKTELRLTKAKDSLVNTGKKITEIAYECGFGSDSYFSKVFVKSEGVTPKQYRDFLKGNNKTCRNIFPKKR